MDESLVIIARKHPYRILYVSFDVVPAPKGAAVHIDKFANALAEKLETVYLITVSPNGEYSGPRVNQQSGLIHIELPALGDDLISRVMHFRRLLMSWLKGKPRFDVIHFRSPLEGLWIAMHKDDYCRRLLFEVNGLPSIELKYRYPSLEDDDQLTKKLEKQEQICLDSADAIVTPSSITREYLISRNVDADKVFVIRNGVDLDLFPFRSPRPWSKDQPIHALYFGTLSPWQGVDNAIRAMALTRTKCRMTIVAQGKRAQKEAILKLVSKLNLTERIDLAPPLLQGELAAVIHRSNIVVAPLTFVDRNTVQGCCPLKVLEGMACGTPVVTSDLPVTRELADGTTCLKFAKPSSDRELASAIDELANDFDSSKDAALLARRIVEHRHDWTTAGKNLVALYQRLCD